MIQPIKNVLLSFYLSQYFDSIVYKEMESSKNILNNLEKFNKEEDENVQQKLSIKQDSDSEDDSLENKNKRKEKSILF